MVKWYTLRYREWGMDSDLVYWFRPPLGTGDLRASLNSFAGANRLRSNCGSSIIQRLSIKPRSLTEPCISVLCMGPGQRYCRYCMQWHSHWSSSFRAGQIQVKPWLEIRSPRIVDVVTPPWSAKPIAATLIKQKLDSMWRWSVKDFLTSMKMVKRQPTVRIEFQHWWCKDRS